MTLDESRLDGVALAISAYRSDDSVIHLLQQVFGSGQSEFGTVIVVDSLGSGAIAREIEANGWPVDYINADRNLGSAGNLDLRLQTAAATGCKWCFALNHDGRVDPAKVLALVRHGTSRDRVGAVYPQLIFSSAGGRPDRPRRAFSSYGLLGRANEPAVQASCEEVVWSSSNGALYHLDPIRDGFTAWPQLWMGYEDLALGWELYRRGWVQLLCRDVTLADDYEFREHRIFGRTVHLADKPSWYAYYQQRNLALIARSTGGKAVSWPGLFGRLIADIALTVLLRDNKRERLQLLLRGLRDGLRGLTGKGPVP